MLCMQEKGLKTVCQRDTDLFPQYTWRGNKFEMSDMHFLSLTDSNYKNSWKRQSTSFDWAIVRVYDVFPLYFFMVLLSKGAQHSHKYIMEILSHSMFYKIEKGNLHFQYLSCNWFKKENK